MLAAGCSNPAAGSRPFDGGADAPGPRIDAHPFDASCPADAMGGGVCPINFCGTLLTQAALPSNAYAQSGADTICNSGRVCVVGPAVAAGNAFQLTCVAPTGTLSFGAACSTDPNAGMHCANDSLCIASADFPSQPFCSTLCRTDADCPSSSSCLEYQTAQAPNGSTAKVGMCTPASKIAGTACVRESDCPANQGCVADGSRTSLNVCKAGGAASVGQLCTSPGGCRSGACYDRLFRLPSGSNRAYCSAICAVNSDCGSDQVCARLVVNDNGTPSDPTDDVVVGQCQTLFTPIPSTGCGLDSDCVAQNNGSDACDATHGLCYNREAVPGSACAADTGCQLGGVCTMATRFPGGYCQTYGCSATPKSSADSCAGAGSVCVQRGAPDAPLHACYAACNLGSDAGAPVCPRPQYLCAPPVPGQPATICIGETGT